MVKRLLSNWWGDLLFGAIVFITYLVIGAYLTLVKNYLPGDALSRLVSAYLVFYGTQSKLATIGFVWPPIPTLLLLPLAWIPFVVETWLAPVVVSALFMSIACVLIGRIANLCNVSRGWQLAVMFLFATNPMILVFGINGMSEAILIATTLGACYWLIRFWDARRDTALILAAGLFGLLPIIRYETAVLTAGAGLLIAFLSWAWREQLPPNKFASLMEGRMLAYSSLAVYPIFLWTIGCWLITGNPLYFLVNERIALGTAIPQIVRMGIYDTSFLSSMRLTFGLWFELFPLGAIATLAAVGVGVWRRVSFLVGLGLVPLTLPFVQGILLSRQTTVPLLRYYIMVIPFAIVVLLVCWKAISSSLEQSNSRRLNHYNKLFLTLLALAFLASNFASGYALSTSRYESVEGETWQELGFRVPVSKGVPVNHVREAVAIGRLLSQIVPEGSRVLLDTYGRGYAVILGAHNPKLFLNHTDPHYDDAVLSPRRFADYLLIPDPSNEEVDGGKDAINQKHPYLYRDGAPWAELVDTLPPTAAGWRLYKIKR
jgi:hypothetical protein